VGTRVRPGSGSILDFSVEEVGLMGGDVDFTSLSADYTIFLTVYEDFLGRKSTLRLNGRATYLIDAADAPVYEKLYLGGRSFRGFEYRTISPKGIRADTGEPSDDPVGGEWLFFLGAQYEAPIFKESLTGVVFIDSGTVTDDVGFDAYRVSAGFGIRLYIPAFGTAPLAFDLGFPIMKEEDDDEQLFSFSLEFPF
jgi:outer membrane protein insertion porin family